MKILQRKEAKEKGLKFYYTGRECKNNHITERRTVTGECLLCAQQERKRNQSNRMNRYIECHGKEYYYQQMKDWYLKTSEGRVSYRQDGRSKNPDYFNLWREGNHDKIKQYYNKPYTKKARQKWNRLNRGKKNFYTRMRQKNIKQATPSWTNRELIKQIYIAAAKLTHGRKRKYHVDHIIPLKGIDPHTRFHVVCGLHVPDNLQILTERRHKKKLNYFTVE